eukprot:COSAG06_NODE_1496_length_9275_cov_20.266783_12_plen_102_part_00
MPRQARDARKDERCFFLHLSSQRIRPTAAGAVALTAGPRSLKPQCDMIRALKQNPQTGRTHTPKRAMIYEFMHLNLSGCRGDKCICVVRTGVRKGISLCAA